MGLGGGGAFSVIIKFSVGKKKSSGFLKPNFNYGVVSKNALMRGSRDNLYHSERRIRREIKTI